MTKQTAQGKKAQANYTPEELQTAVSMYSGKNNKAEVPAIAAKLGKSPASVRSKLASEGVYVKEKPATKKPAGQTKADVAEKVGKAIGLNDVETEALAKTTTAVLAKLLDHLTNAEEGSEEGSEES